MHFFFVNDFQKFREIAKQSDPESGTFQNNADGFFEFFQTRALKIFHEQSKEMQNKINSLFKPCITINR